MALKNHSLFYYGHIIDDTNNLINFKEGLLGEEKTVELPVGSYTLTRFVETVVGALNAGSSIDWSFIIDRKTRIVSLFSSAPASLLFGTGTTATSAPSTLLGFPAQDKVNLTTFVGSIGSGYSFAPQFPLQDYKSKLRNKKMVNAVVSKSASGDSVSVQSFGVDRFMKCNIKWVTNQRTTGLLRYNSQGVEGATVFMDYIVEKHPIEFMENEILPFSFDKVYLESTPSDSNGTSYELTEFVERDLPEYFETGLLTFKVINLE